ncbi:hypothetical protein XELAEV_18028083mg [Xenopus laevis]|uniref:DUF4371 domain-containing protein n=1 Tax=Xenopus laevis TaxID=8355 RepID=A0A974CYT5_XENLA|nr:hypothetical protein XELAEV_18028083mg [Xenopus laevis]
MAKTKQRYEAETPSTSEESPSDIGLSGQGTSTMKTAPEICFELDQDLELTPEMEKSKSCAESDGEESASEIYAPSSPIASKSLIQGDTISDDIPMEDTPKIEINLNDPPSWPEITDQIRRYLVQQGPDQGKDGNFGKSQSHEEHSFNPKWFTKQIPSGRKIERSWLIYSKTSNSLSCFPSHENSTDHRENHSNWKRMEKRMKEGKFIDSELEKMITTEKQKWRNVLKCILDAILFFARNNLALRGSTDVIGSPDADIFLDIIEVIGHHNIALNEKIETHQKGSTNYFSHKIQNEFISILGKRVRSEIIGKIKEAKYYSLILDCTPDICHQEQMSEIIRYVSVVEGKVKVEESFIDFIHTKEKSGSGLASEILNKLQADGIDIKDARGQGYDNAANIAGKYNGVQARILEENEYAKCVPCAAHGLNLAGVQAASVNAEMKTFFGTVQRLFTFFSSSTSHWEIMKNMLKTTLKGHTDTRWASRASAVKALFAEIINVCEALSDIRENSSNSDSVSTAQSLLLQVDYHFLCTLFVWNKILGQVDRVNQALQAKDISIIDASKMIDGLRRTFQEMRDIGVDEIYLYARDVCDKLGIPATFPQKRKRKVKVIASYESADEGASLSAGDNFTISLNQIFDVLISDLTWKSKTLMDTSVDFEFLSCPALVTFELPQLQKAASDLALKYSKDLDASELCSEIETFKHQVEALLPDAKSATPLDLCQMIEEYSLADCYPNIVTALRIFLTLPVTVASCERSYSKLKLIKNYSRSSMGQERLSNLSILSIEHEIAKKIDFDNVIDHFAAIKARKIAL